MKSNKRYVTFSCFNHKNEKSRFAIECETSMEAIDVAMDISSYACFKNVWFNNSGRFVKGTTIINSKDYKRYFSDSDSFAD